ncbi:hypothetical protein [Vreelandella indica]|uniref:hypothetical protein n=1 Tax=Vreelandella indica TaxID=3126500 RepID=UPI00300E650F|tara:strand:- start:4325 stop:4555 length:231 start_codon:yes stop_codon:yes gene_type:complete
MSMSNVTPTPAEIHAILEEQTKELLSALETYPAVQRFQADKRLYGNDENALKAAMMRLQNARLLLKAVYKCAEGED